MPLLSEGGNLRGTFALYYSEPKSPDADDIARLEKASYIALIAIERDQAQTSRRIPLGAEPEVRSGPPTSLRRCLHEHD